MLDRVDEGDSWNLLASMSQQTRKEIADYSVTQNLTTLRNRVNELGVSEPLVLLTDDPTWAATAARDRRMRTQVVLISQDLFEKNEKSEKTEKTETVKKILAALTPAQRKKLAVFNSLKAFKESLAE